MISLLIYVLVAILIFGCIVYVIQIITLPQPFKNVAYVIVLIILILVLLDILGVLPGRAL